MNSAQAVRVKEHFDAPKDPSLSKTRAWTEIRLDHLRHNVNYLKRFMRPGCGLMAVVKAQAYGHGVARISSYLQDMGIEWFAVATLAEAIELRESGIRGNILILGYTHPSAAPYLVRYDLTQTVVDASYARTLGSCGLQIKVHVKIDTGMHRLGEDHTHLSELCQVYQMKHLFICGTYTHLCCSDCLNYEQVSFTEKQIARFYHCVRRLKETGCRVGKLHIQSSYAILNYPQASADFARAGLFLYGAFSKQPGRLKELPDLRPVLSYRARIAHIRELKAGETAGYDCAFRADSRRCLAVVSAGFADGIPRSMSQGRGFALVSGKRVPIAGNVCMDQLLLDITDVSGVRQGDIVTFIGKDGVNEITADEMAQMADTIPNELLSRLGERLCRIYRGE